MVRLPVLLARQYYVAFDPGEDPDEVLQRAAHEVLQRAANEVSKLQAFFAVN